MRVDLDFQPEGYRGIGLGCEGKDQVDRMSRGFAAAWPEPGQGLANGVDRGANGFWPHLHEVDILRISERLAKEELVDRGPAAERQVLGEHRLVEDVAQCPADDQVLFDLAWIWPRCRRGSLLNVGGRNHASISSGTLRLSFQAGASRGLPAPLPRAAGRFTEGSSGFSDFATLANERRADA